MSLPSNPGRDTGNLDVLKVKFTHFNTVRDKKPYTIYEIEVRSSSTISWVIYKRYSDFFKLHQDLLKLKAAAAPHSALGLVELPALPPKRLTRSLAAEFVEKRKMELQDYLRELLSTSVLRLHLLKFLEVPDSVRPMLARSGPGDSDIFDASDVGDSSASVGLPRGFQHKSHEERKVLELVNLLGHNKSKVAAIKTFEDYYFDARPRLSSELIRLLFHGEHGAESEGGLIQTCGDFKYSHVASRAALDLIVRLLDVEKNKDAQQFLDTFCSLDTSVLQKLQLHLHILSERGNRLGAFRLVSVLKSRLPDLAVEKVVCDPYARQEFFRWAERKNEAIAPTAHESQDTVMRSLNLAEVGVKKIADQAFQDILQIAHMEQGWKVVRYTKYAPPSPSPTPDGASSSPAIGQAPGLPRSPSANSFFTSNAQNHNNQKENRTVANHVNGPSSNGTSGLPSNTSSSSSSSNNVRITYKLDQRRDMVIVRLTAHLPYSVDSVCNMLLDTDSRSAWDLTFHHGNVVEKIDDHTQVAHHVFKSFSSPYKYRDFCLLRSWTKMENGTRIVACRSVLHPNVPEQKNHVRAVLFPTGYILTPMVTPATTPNTSPTATTRSPGFSISRSITDPSLNNVAPRLRNISIPKSYLTEDKHAELEREKELIRQLEKEKGRKELLKEVKEKEKEDAVMRQKELEEAEKQKKLTVDTETKETVDGCLLTFVAQMDRESVLIISPDLLGETNQLAQSVELLKQCIRRRSLQSAFPNRDTAWKPRVSIPSSTLSSSLSTPSPSTLSSTPLPSASSSFASSSTPAAPSSSRPISATASPFAASTASQALAKPMVPTNVISTPAASAFPTLRPANVGPSQSSANTNTATAGGAGFGSATLRPVATPAAINSSSSTASASNAASTPAVPGRLTLPGVFGGFKK